MGYPVSMSRFAVDLDRRSGGGDFRSDVIAIRDQEAQRTKNLAGQLAEKCDLTSRPANPLG